MTVPGSGNKVRDAAAARLRATMSAISERAHGEAWAEELEYALWTLLRRGGGQYGRTVVTPAEVGTLRALSAQCGGWIALDESAGERVFVPRAEWDARLAARAG